MAAPSVVQITFWNSSQESFPGQRGTPTRTSLQFRDLNGRIAALSRKIDEAQSEATRVSSMAFNSRRPVRFRDRKFLGFLARGCHSKGQKLLERALKRTQKLLRRDDLLLEGAWKISHNNEPYRPLRAHEMGALDSMLASAKDVSFSVVVPAHAPRVTYQQLELAS